MTVSTIIVSGRIRHTVRTALYAHVIDHVDVYNTTAFLIVDQV